MTETVRAEDISILVLGDVNVDTLLVPLAAEGWWRHRRRGGAWLLDEIIRAGLQETTFKANMAKVWGKTPTVGTYDENSNHVTDKELQSAAEGQPLNLAAILGLFPRAINGVPGDKTQVYRLERLLNGVHNEKDQAKRSTLYRGATENCLKGPYTVDRTAKQDILVLHDKASDFRHLNNADLKEALERHYKPDKTWIVWQMYSPLAAGELWKVMESHKEWWDRTVVVVKVECLRQEGANLPDNISLEQESEQFEEIMKDPRAGPALKRLANMGHLVVHYHRQGVLHWDKNRGGLDTSCYYCPYVPEQPPSRELGTMVGYTSILVAAIVRGMTWSLANERKEMAKGIIEGIRQGVVLDHLHFLHGYSDEGILSQPKLPDPYQRLFEKFTAVAANGEWKDQWNNYRLAAALRVKGADAKKWSRIEGFIDHETAGLAGDEEGADGKATEEHPNKKKERAARKREAMERAQRGKRQAEQISEEIVCRGIEKVIEGNQHPAKEGETPGTPPHDILCPFEVHGKIKTAFRDEIDSFASIRRIIRRYLDDDDWQSPLSIAVFGPPGSGKSFTVRQILESVDPEIVKRPLEYNLTQFDAAEDLETAFHKVQDKAVAGEVPLVFFDEFDTKDHYWLKHFLAPMQDGTFKAGENTYRIGRAIFVFAGGVSYTWHDFYEKRKAAPKSPEFENFRRIKGTDFVSRLRGHLDIATINPAEGKDVDRVLMFRRAVLLRSLLEHHLKGIIDKNSKEARIDLGVVRAFLKVRRYEHEARSMQAIIEMSRVSPRRRFQVSSLPAMRQLNMHVSADDFRTHLH